MAMHMFFSLFRAKFPAPNKTFSKFKILWEIQTYWAFKCVYLSGNLRKQVYPNSKVNVGMCGDHPNWCQETVILVKLCNCLIKYVNNVCMKEGKFRGN